MVNTISSYDRLSPQSKVSSDLTSAQHQSNEVKVNKNTSRSVVPSQVQLPSNGLQIVHATTGRVRIRAIEGSFNSELKTITQYLQQQPGVKEVAANRQTGSLTISFDENQLSLAQVLGLLQQFGIDEMQTSSESINKGDPFAAWKSLDFWKEQSISFIPLMTGLAVTGGLGISGLAAIPVYMITADATRWVIDNFDLQVSGEDISKTADAVDVIKSPEALLSKEEGKSASVEKSSDLQAESVKISYGIVHAIPGRIRFHVPQLAHDRAYAKRLERIIKTDPHVMNVRVNCDAGSIAIAYQPSEINISHWVDLMELALQNNAPTNPIQTTQLQTPSDKSTLGAESPSEELIQATESIEGKTLDLSTLWVDMKPSSLSYSLAFMANFPL